MLSPTLFKRSYEFGPFVLDPLRRTLLRDGNNIRIGPLDFDILHALVQHPGRNLPRKELVRSVWKENKENTVDERTLNLHICTLRKALGDNPNNPQYVLTIQGVGYRFISEVKEVCEEDTTATAPVNGAATGDELDDVPSHDSAATTRQPSRALRFMLAVVGVLVVMVGVALWLAQFALAALALCITAATVIYGYQHVKDTPFARVAVSVLVLGAMAFVPTGCTQLQVIASAVNMTTLKPAVAYPFITGLQYIPQFVLIFGSWVVLGLRNDVGFPQRPVMGKSYIRLGIVFQLTTIISVVVGFNNYQIWRAGLPGRWLILICYLIVFSINLGLWRWARGFFKQDTISSYSALFSWCAVAYLFLVIPAIFIGKEYNHINTHFLDKRRPAAYVVTNPDAIKDFIARNDSSDAKVGMDLRSMLNDPGFQSALITKRFYKQNFDEPFQVFDRAVMYGYKNEPSSPQDRPTFVIIRFPEELAVALRFQFVGEDE
jgi:DNA-binding winged helix-turn-helix (wHTH) protein